MNRILSIAPARQLHVVEDAAHACGGLYSGRWLGTLGDLGCFSFGQYKVVSAGEGGMVVTNDDRLAMRVRSYHDTAACWRPSRYAPERVAGELFPGDNYRMSELHGAVARAQLEKLEGYLERHRAFRTADRECLATQTIAPLTPARDNDPDGDAGEWLVLMAPSPDIASR